jgi:anti-anti-sigma factor
MQAEAHAAGRPVVVDLEGDIDVARAGLLGDRLCALIETGPPAIAVVCSSDTFIESRGLAMMARVQRYADEAGCRLAWRGLPLHALRTIHLTGLDAYLVIEA